MKSQIYDYVMAKLEDSKGHWRIVAAGSGVPKRTLEKIASKEIPNPGIKSIQALADYFRKVR